MISVGIMKSHVQPAMEVKLKEDQYTVCAWANKTFGKTNLTAACERAAKEMREFIEGDLKDVPNECADVVITLFRVADEAGFDLMNEVNKKMRINRQRKWVLNGDGTGQHE